MLGTGTGERVDSRGGNCESSQKDLIYEYSSHTNHACSLEGGEQTDDGIYDNERARKEGNDGYYGVGIRAAIASFFWD